MRPYFFLANKVDFQVLSRGNAPLLDLFDNELYKL